MKLRWMVRLGYFAILALAMGCVPARAAQVIVWDGAAAAGGKGWVAPPGPNNSMGPETGVAHSGAEALVLHSEGKGYSGGGWNWFGWYPANAGTDTRPLHNLVFWVMVKADPFPDKLEVALVSSGSKKPGASVSLGDYVPHVNDGAWHEAVIPLVDLEKGNPDFDPAKVWEIDLSAYSTDATRISVFLDDIGFDDRAARSQSEAADLPTDRQPAPLGDDVENVTASVDTKALGTPINQFIYGAAMADRTLAKEIGLTILRAGGNEVTAINWKDGFYSKGADWFYTNDGQALPPEKNWLLTFPSLNRAAGLETYLTMPMMGRVAKDGTSAAFDIRKYPDQESWAGKLEPGDPHWYAGNGKQYVRGADGQIEKDKDGKPVLKEIPAVPDDTSIEMTPADQTEMLRYMIQKMGDPGPDHGGVKYIALDNEPMLWNSTHRGMHPQGTSYDDLWDRTLTYASLLKKIDPGVQIAGPALWGWTAYFYSGLDKQLIDEGKGAWADPPDYAAHGHVPLLKWYLQKLNDYKKANGHALVDILDVHFYPQNGSYDSKATDAATMENRVQETRVLWDPTWKDPSWMGSETGKVVQLIPLMKSWIAEKNPGMKLAIGEYNFGGEGDVSGGVAQAELLGIFAKEGLDFACYWFAPPVNSSTYFAFKMYRNPDGKHTVFGDRYLPAAINAPDDVSVHSARDSATGRLTFVLVNKRAAKGEQVALTLAAPVSAQDVIPYEYSGADPKAIGRLPAWRVEGDRLNINLPPMSVLRFDLKP